MSENKLNQCKNIDKTIYPKQFTAYFMVSIFITVALFFITYILIRKAPLEDIKTSDVFLMTSWLSIVTLIIFNYAITILFLIKKKIKIEIRDGAIELKKVFSKKKFEFYEIESIRIAQLNFRYPITFVIIKGKKKTNKFINRYIMFPKSWFSTKDIKYIVKIIKKYNDKVSIDGMWSLN